MADLFVEDFKPGRFHSECLMEWRTAGPEAGAVKSIIKLLASDPVNIPAKRDFKSIRLIPSLKYIFNILFFNSSIGEFREKIKNFKQFRVPGRGRLL
ncbi:hypothetical protein [uncultured Marinococcus sp.]|uniref:hypothetical protein n=1 Tax=uncultured Marinococcus sp. TaxID=487012 RepID=UPI0026188BC5|nr:hypothetical protein [uncultured Marinococcus sp.]